MHINSDIKLIVSREVYYDLSDWAKSNLKNDASFSIGENRMEIITRGSKYIIELIDGGKKLSQKRYLEHIKDHLTEYKKNTFPELPDGVFKRNSKTHYPYILFDSINLSIFQRQYVRVMSFRISFENSIR